MKVSGLHPRRSICEETVERKPCSQHAHPVVSEMNDHSVYTNIGI
jgi:hypothetical protein